MVNSSSPSQPMAVGNIPPSSNGSKTQQQQSSPPTSNAVPSLLLKLLEACAKHKRKHDQDKKDKKSSCNINNNTLQQQDWCHKELKSFQNIFPRLESTIHARHTFSDEYQQQNCNNGDTNVRRGSSSILTEINDGEDAVGHICALYRAIARGSFCPHAYHYLFVNGNNKEVCNDGELVATDGNIAIGILPRISKLLQALSLDPVRIALSPIPEHISTLDESMKIYYGGEDVGATIATLLNMLQDDQLRLAAVHDLINLSNDLSTIDESGALFEPPLSEVSDGGEGENHQNNGNKIRIHIFTEVAHILQKGSNTNANTEYPKDMSVQIPSRRSLLALQCEVWESLRRLVPKVTQAQGDERNNIELINSLLSSSGSTSFLSPPSSSQEPHNQDWSYSPVDVSIHSLLLLRTKMAIVGLFTDIISWADLDTSVQIHLALISVEAIKQQLLWDQHNCSEDIPKETRKLENSLDSMYSRAVSKFMALAVLFPNDTAAKNDLWSHSFPHLMDCIPLMTDSSNDCLRKVVLRAVYIMLSRTGDSHHQTPSLLNSSTTSFIDLFRNRCLVRGYFSHLFGLVKDYSESVNGPAVSIIVRLLESVGCEDLVETACSNALSSIEGDIDPTSDNLNKDSPLIRLGTKRRKIESSHEGKGSTSPSASIQSAFTHAVADALDDTQRILSRLTEGSKRTSSSDGCVSLVSESETHLLRSVAGTLRVLLSMCGKTNGNSFTDKVITRLFECVTAVCGVLVKQKSDDKLVHVEPRLFRSAVSSVVAVGLHACRALKGTSINHLSAREAISYCALSAVPLIEFDRGRQIDGSMSSNILLEANNKNNMGGGICSRLVEMIGASAKKADISLYGLTCDESEDECDAFAYEIMPLQCRCILLATVCPVVSSSEQYEPTMSSIRCILASPTPSQAPPAIVKTALLGLPTLFLSLAQRKDDNVAASTKYLTLMMNSFNFEDLVIRYTKPDIEEGIQVSAFLTLSRLVKIYTAASLVVGHDDASDNSQSSKASSYLWHHLNPTTNGIHTVLLSLLSSAGDDDAFTTSKDAAHFHDSLSMPALSNRGSSTLSMQGDSPQQCMSSLIYLRSVLAVAPESKLRSSNTLEFFTDKRHYDILVNIVKKMDNSDMEEGSLSDEQIPPPVWVFLMPFLSRDAATQMYAASTFGKTLLNDECKVLFACFRIPESEMRADQISCEAARRAVNSLFVEIDFILRLCGLDRDVLISKELDNLPGYNTNFDNNTPERISNVGAAIGIFSSLCKWAPLNTHIGNFIIEGSVLALVRIWISATGGYAFDSNSLPDDPTSHFSLASHAFQGLNTIFKQNNGDEVCSTIKNSMSKIFSEFFLPQYDIVASTRYRLLCLFIGSFLLPDSSTGQSQPAHNTFEVSVATEINTYIDSVYPSIIVHFVKAEDHEAIQMCAAFRMYLLSEGKRMAREEKRVQKKELNEYIMGTRYESKHSGQLARSLIPGVEISTNKLIENAKLLCIKKDVILYVLPQLLLNPNRAPLRFFTTKLCQSELDYPDILQEFGLLVLKRLVWELGADDPEEDKEEEMFNTSAVGNYHKRKDVVLALSKGYLLKERSEADKAKHLLLSPSQESTDNIICPKAASRWVAPNFMYLLMNLVNKKWDKRSKSDKFQVIKCLRSMLQFITSSSDSPQYMSPIMTAINDAISDNCHNPKLDFIATATLFDYIKIVASDASQVVGDNLTSITVALFPLFDGRKDSPARRRAVEMLEWLASGEANDSLPLRFNEIPLLPFTQDLAKVRSILVKKGVQLDDIRLLSQHSGQEEDIDDSQLKSRFHNRMNILSKLIVSHENQNVRKVVITHMTDLIKANRDLFHELVVNEELSSINFLTVVHEESDVDPVSGESGDDATNGGFITKLLIRLLSRCVDEPRPEIRDAIASCLGEIGAIDPNRLGKEINSTQIGQESDDSSAWRLRNPPWQTQVADYQLRLVSRHLVSGLKSASVAIDGHKISFSIQELLKILDGHFGGENENDMTPLLKEKLQQADVFNIVEPFWTTNYKQVDVIAAKTPPFFIKSSTYFSWLSSFCRFLVTRSYANKKSVWGDFFHACRSAIRSKACVGVAEFLLPLFVLDTMCFGTKNDKDVVVDEFIQVLTFDEGDTTSKMDLKEREKAANAVFSVMDVLRYWLEKEVERKHQPTRGGRSKGRATNNSTANDGAEFSWPATESIKKTEQLLKRIPLSSCAVAASKVGMRARALQFLEMEGRTKAQANDGYKKDDTKGISRFLKSDYLFGIDSQLTQVLHGQLNDFDTMVFVAEKNHEADLTKRLTEEAVEREMYEDWEGAFQAYEQLLDSRLINNNNNNQSSSTLDDVENSKANAQKGIIRCLLKLGRLDSVLNQASGMSSKQSTIAMGNDGGGSVQISDELLPSAAEAAWRLGDWDQLDNLVNNVSDESALDSNASFQLEFGRTMHSLHSKTQENFVIGLKDSRESIMSSLSSAARDGYTSSYPYLTQLHALREVECVSTTFFDKNQSNFQQSFINVVSSEQWSDRLELSTSDTTGSNAILNTRLGLSRMANEPTIEGLMWLDIGKVARKGGLHRVAEQSLIQANASFCKSLNVSEKARESIGSVKLQIAKLKHAIGETTTALKLIEDDIPDSIFLMDDKQLNSYVSSDKTESTATARRILQSTEWMACDGLKSSTEIKDRYQTVLKLAPNWERAHFNYAKFLDSLYESRVSSSSGDRGDTTRSVEECQDYLLNAVQHYGMSLQLGQKHVYQALPRLLAMWLEFTSLSSEEMNCEESSIESDRLAEKQGLMNKMIKSLASKIPEHLFYTALPQLISRVEHCNNETAKNVAMILRAVLAKYPRQAMWYCGWLRFSKSDQKKKIGDEVFHGAQKMLKRTEKGKATQNVLSASKSLFQFFISLAQFVPKGNHSSVKMKVPKFDTDLTNFIPPIQAALSLSPGALGERSADTFPPLVPRMRAFNPELKIMQSKAKPKKVSIFAVPTTVASRGEKLPTDGHSITQDAGEMHFLVKQEAKGDLRKDSRVQDLNNVINRLFAQRKGASGPNSRRKRLRLQLRTFSVVCLAEDCGILEWVPNTESLRSVVTETYNPLVPHNSIHRRGSRITNFADPELRETFQRCQDVYFKKGNLDLATKKFDELVLKQYLPVLYWWFTQNFASPHAWYEARTNFTLSTAVWSAVGHIIGLGDRHSENILIDKESGECVHVDFDCIFDKGLLLPRPEVIPFRLTPNMLDAFGPTGADGMYTGALTESMRTLRLNKDTLLSVLEPFLNDPVINFKSKNQQKSKEDKVAKDTKTAMASMAKIQGRLNGEYNITNPNKNKKNKKKDATTMVDTTHFTKLSVEGQVQKMIMEATDKENLVQVYVGWMPWI